MEHLVRYPTRKFETLRAWDAADEYLLAEIQKYELAGKKILILNDHFGALSSALAQYQPTTYTDSFVSMRAIEINTNKAAKQIHQLSQLDGPYDFVLLQIPKSLSFFEDQLYHLSQHLHSDSQIFCGFMTKYFTPTNYQLLEKIIGPIQPLLAVKKAKLVTARFERGPQHSPWPKEVMLDQQGKSFTHHSHLFSREKLDIGTRFFLEHLPQGHFLHILDLGCANGILGIEMKKKIPDSHLHFSDDSMMAILSAKANWQKFYPEEEASFHWTNCFENGGSSSLDAVVCNPPFHQGNTIGDFIAKQMFEDAKRCLKTGGVLSVVGNSHLGYHSSLKKLFGHSKIVAQNKKFMVVEAQKRS